MTSPSLSIHPITREEPHSVLEAWRAAGAELALRHGTGTAGVRARMRRQNRRRRLNELITRAAAGPEKADWLIDNFRVILGAEADTRDFTANAKDLPALADSSGRAVARVCLLVRRYLRRGGYRFQESEFVAFVEGYQDHVTLDLREIWSFRPALQLELIDRLLEAEPADWAVLVASLQEAGETTWEEVIEGVSQVHRVLMRDPAGAYLRMDFESRDRYCGVVGALARRSPLSELEVAQAAIDLAEAARDETCVATRADFRTTHVGYYLIDRGRKRIERVIDYQPSWTERIARLVLRRPTAFYLAGAGLLTLGIVGAAAWGLGSAAPVWMAAPLLLLPASQAAIDFVNQLVSFLFPPRILPKLDFSEGIPDDCATMVAVPALLLHEQQVRNLVADLEIRFLGNRGRNLHFALLTDPPDSDRPEDERDGLVELSSSLIEGLNQRYGNGKHAPFFLFHRHRAYNGAEGCWMGWERKRGKLLDFNQLARGGFDAFPVKVGDLSVLPKLKYVITLDSDTELPRESAAKLIGAMAHPLNQAVVDPATHMVVEGYGILQPRVGISVKSASRSKLAALYSGNTGFDLYTRAVSDVYQDLFGEGIFTGKGIYEIDTLREVLEHRFPENALLSHDLIEGAYARVALAADIELIDGYPSHFSAYSRRKHRWMRGDWQIMRWILSNVPDRSKRQIRNPITRISQWKILDNLRRSLLEPGMLALLLAGWLWLPGRAAYWTAAALVIWCFPVLFGLFFSLLRMPHRWKKLRVWALDTAGSVRENGLITLCRLVFLLHESLISLDAVARTMARVWVTKKRLLQWETAEAAEAGDGSKATVDLYLEWTPWLALALGAAIALVRPGALPAAAPLLVLWMASRGLSTWLNGRPRAEQTKLDESQLELLRESAGRAWRFFADWSSPATNWMIPDQVREDGSVDLRVSPTNLGMLLNARIAGLHCGVLSLAQFIYTTRQTLDRVVKMPKFRGHLFNWYEIASLSPLPPYYVSAVDSGNLAASLWTLKQAALAFAGSSSPVPTAATEEQAAELRAIAEICDSLVADMDFAFLYRPRKAALAVGYDAATRRLDASSYTLLASEARVAVFIAVAKGDIPLAAWLHLGRAHTTFEGEHVLLSWGGTMFEYLMPALWMYHHRDTVLEQTMKAAVRAQRAYARRHNAPWGISESAFPRGRGNDYGYQALGIPELALERKALESLVISPYSSFLAAAMDPAAAAENLRLMQARGWVGWYGFYEAIDCTGGKAELVRMWMAHHQGMSLLAMANLLFDNPLPRYFHAEPQVRATERLLHERVPAAAFDCEPALLPSIGPAVA